MKTVFRPAVSRIFSDDFRTIPVGKHEKLLQFTEKLLPKGSSHVCAGRTFFLDYNYAISYHYRSIVSQRTDPFKKQ